MADELFNGAPEVNQNKKKRKGGKGKNKPVQADAFYTGPYKMVCQ